MGAAASTIPLSTYQEELQKPADASDFRGEGDEAVRAEVVRLRSELAKYNPESVDLSLRDLDSPDEDQRKEKYLGEIMHIRKMLRLESLAQARERRRRLSLQGQSLVKFALNENNLADDDDSGDEGLTDDEVDKSEEKSEMGNSKK